MAVARRPTNGSLTDTARAIPPGERHVSLYAQANCAMMSQYVFE